MSRSSRTEASEKIRIVEEYLTGKMNIPEASRVCGVYKSTICRWISKYKAEGVTGFLALESNRVYSKETKLMAVMDYLGGKGSLQDICEKYKIKSNSQLRDWVKVYNSHEEFRIFTGGSRMTKKRETTLAERIEIVRECIDKNNNYGEIAQKYQVSYRQVYTWVKKYRVMGETGLEDRRGRRAGMLTSRTPEEELRDRIAQLEREKFNLEMENELLKKVKELESRRR